MQCAITASFKAQCVNEKCLRMNNETDSWHQLPELIKIGKNDNDSIVDVGFNRK
jgi:hypothetical protein